MSAGGDTSSQVIALLSFLAGAASGAIGAVSVFRATIAVLQTQVAELIKDTGIMQGTLTEIVRDQNGIAALARDVAAAAAKVAQALPIINRGGQGDHE